MEITKEFKFSYAHILPGHRGHCRNLHGHNARVLVTLTGDVNDTKKHSAEGMVLDFHELSDVFEKEVKSKFDHKFLACGDEWVCDAATMFEAAAPSQDDERVASDFIVSDQIVRLRMRTTAENLAKIIYALLTPEIMYRANKQVRVSSVTFYETDSGSATVKDLSLVELDDIWRKVNRNDTA